LRFIIGRPHANAEAAVHLLRKQNLRYINQVDIFDAGPYFGQEVNEVDVIRHLRRGRAREGSGEHPLIVANRRAREFRACIAASKFDNNNEVRLSKEVMEILDVASGDEVAVYDPSTAGG
jgi:arginine/ornithine N-succinyltransferase beta subunit